MPYIDSQNEAKKILKAQEIAQCIFAIFTEKHASLLEEFGEEGLHDILLNGLNFCVSNFILQTSPNPEATIKVFTHNLNLYLKRKNELAKKTKDH